MSRSSQKLILILENVFEKSSVFVPFRLDRMNGTQKVYEFGAFRFIPSENLLLRDGETVALPAKAIGVLTALVANHGHAVSKDDLIRDVWNGVFVEESTVSRNVWLVRQALCDDPRNAEFIQTIPKFGYRFIADVRVLGAEQADPVDTGGVERIAPALRRRHWLAVVLGVLLLALAAAGYFYFNERSSIPEGPRSIAVLPFRPVNTGARDEILEVGLADSLIHRLASYQSGIVVRPLSTIRKYSEVEQDPLAAGREQNTNYVLASNYQLSDGKIRVTTQLYDVATGLVDFAHKFETEASTAFTMQDAVAREIGNRLAARFGVQTIGSGSARGTDNEEAYRYYLLAQNFNELRGSENGRIALEQIDRAVALDPNFARAWATKAYIHRYMGYGPAAMEHSQRSMDAVKKALSLDPDLSEAHSTLCFNKFRFEYDFEEAERACRRAVELDPNSPLAHKLYANFLYTRGRFDEALYEVSKAIDLQPVSYDNQQTYGLALYFARRYADAERQWKRLLPLNPDHRIIYVQMIKSLVPQGKEPEALEHLIKLLILENAGDDTIRRFRNAFATSGWRGVTFERIRWGAQRQNATSFDLARLYATVGDKDNAFIYLERAFQERSNMIAVLEVDPELDPLRDDPRYAALLRRIERK
jgi:DNA-binding winged helix-turn-helix (wHTH) protein/TolB-like protein/Tfp pilus assembly protein PilF